MNKFELVAKPGKIALAFAVAVGVGLVAVLITYGLISRFSNWTPTRIMPIALGIGAVVAVGMVMSTLFSTIKRIELDGQSLRIQMLAGGVKEYRLGENQFAPKLTHQMNRGQHVGTTRALQIIGPHGTDTHTITFEAEEFNELINHLTGRAATGPAHPQGLGTADAPAAAAVRGPLAFQPQRFEISRKPLNRFYITLYISAAVVLGLGVAIAVAAWREGTDNMASFVLLGAFALFALLVLIPVLMMRRRAAKLPKQIVVAPTWVSFDERTFNYTDLKVIQIKPQGEFIKRSAKILTKADERIIYELGIGNYPKMFADYDHFAHLLEQAGTAAAGVVRIDWS